MSHIYTFKKLKNYGLVHGVTTRGYGSIKKSGKIEKRVMERVIFDMNADVKKIIFAEQVHEDGVVFCNIKTMGYVPGVDGLITTTSNLMLGVTNADCLSVIFFDKRLRILGICHAGYKGLHKGILYKMYKSFVDFGSLSSDLILGLGPAIGICCYDVPYARIKGFLSKYPFLKKIYRKSDEKYFLNIRLIARQMLIDLGAVSHNIDEIEMCTKCNNSSFFSFRGDTKETFGRFATVAYLNE